jgi:1-acyl-sn-glycerol-3-phosphate acyltransferase
MIWLRSLAFNIVFYGVTAFMCFLMLWSLVLPRGVMIGVAHLWLWQVAWIEKHIGGMSYRVVGRENIPEGSVIIAAKHQSAWETFKLHILFGDPAIVLKKELMAIPFWGWYLRRAGMIPIDRASGGKAISGMMLAAHRAKDAGRKIVIFPQGTRLVPGEWRPYKNGVAALYQELNLPVVPMALNSGMFWPKNSFIKKPGTITIEFLSPIPPGLPREELMKHLKDRLEQATDELVTSVGGPAIPESART